jgi:hypothetical protein
MLAPAIERSHVSLPSILDNSHARRLAALAAAVVAMLASAPAASAAMRLVSPSGSDGGNCLSAPCATLARAYNVAAAGDVISIAPGVYPRQEIPSGSKAVTFSGQAGNKIRQLHNHAANVTFDGIDVDANFATPTGAAFESNAEGVTVKNSRIGNVIDEKGALLGGWSSTASMRVVLDNVIFHDVYQEGEGVHNECLFSQVPGLTVRNSTFTNCATMDMMITRGDWWGQPSYGGLTLENNVFAHSTQGRDPRWHYFGFLVHGNMGRLTDMRVVNNTFENEVGGIKSAYIDQASGVWANNIGGGWDCLSGVTYRGNVGKKCHASDAATTPAASCAPPLCSPRQTQPVAWLDPVNYDFRIGAGSMAIDVGDASLAPATDRRGYRRDARPDAGAYEYGAGPDAGAPPADPPGQAGRRWRLRSAKLLARQICHVPRRGCPASTKLRLRLARPARVSVRIQRLRKGKAPKQVRSIALKRVKLHKARRIRAAGLPAGRYRVLVRATDATGERSAVVRLRLRVR